MQTRRKQGRNGERQEQNRSRETGDTDWMITSQPVNKSIKVGHAGVCVLSVERSRGKTFQLKMADYEEAIARVRKERLSGIILKPGQKEAIKSFLDGKNVFAVLPTGFGKVLFTKTLSSVKKSSIDIRQHVIIVIPLRNIVQEQLTSNEFNLKAVELIL